MTSIADLMIPISALGGIAALIWGAATIVKGSQVADTVQSTKIDKHDDECTKDRRSNRDAISALGERVSRVEAGKRDK